MKMNESSVDFEYDNQDCYSIQITCEGLTLDRVYQIRKNVWQRMQRVKDKNPKYKNIHFIAGVSNKDPKNPKIIYVKNGKVGRPKKEILGKSARNHVHVYAYSYENKYVSGFAQEVCEGLRRKNYEATKHLNRNLATAIEYVYKQSISVWTTENFSPKTKKNKSV